MSSPDRQGVPLHLSPSPKKKKNSSLLRAEAIKPFVFSISQLGLFHLPTLLLANPYLDKNNNPIVLLAVTKIVLIEPKPWHIRSKSDPLRVKSGTYSVRIR